MNSLNHAALVKLAYSLPTGDENRRAIIAYVAKTARPDYKSYAERKRREGKKPMSQEEWSKRTDGKEEPEEGPSATKPGVAVNSERERKAQKLLKDAEELLGLKVSTETHSVEEVKAHTEKCKKIIKDLGDLRKKDTASILKAEGPKMSAVHKETATKIDAGVAKMSDSDRAKAVKDLDGPAPKKSVWKKMYEAIGETLKTNDPEIVGSAGFMGGAAMAIAHFMPHAVSNITQLHDSVGSGFHSVGAYSHSPVAMTIGIVGAVIAGSPIVKALCEGAVNLWRKFTGKTAADGDKDRDPAKLEKLIEYIESHKKAFVAALKAGKDVGKVQMEGLENFPKDLIGTLNAFISDVPKLVEQLAA